jgi:glyoxylase-like metal-dependent hydrolase (beta-lactamase superfamily II)
MHSHDPHRLGEAPSIRRFPVRSPTLPPATHTNAYVVGTAETGLAVIDPASPWDEEQGALDRYLDALAIPIAAVVLTHHHVDHVGGAAHLARRTGAPIIAHRATADLLAGRLAVDRTLDEGDVLAFGPAGLRALHTPGHASGHLCFLDEAAGVLIAGDMVASVGTIIIDPAPGEGDMRLYLASLERLRALGCRVLLPAHGDPIRDPHGHLSFYLAHRLEREGRVVAAMQQGPATVEDLVPRAYPDVAPAVYPLAARSLLAHLLKLQAEARAVEEAGLWRVPQ